MVAPWVEEQKAEAERKERKRDTFRAESREMYRRSQVPSDDRELGKIAPLAAVETAEADGELKQPVGRSHWAMEEMIKADLGDKRLNKRLVGILSNLAERPTASIPAACGGHAEMTATYHFFDNPKVTWEKVIQPHQAATRQRMAQQPVVLLVQDTTEIDVTRPQQQVVGAGPLDGPTRRGAFAHVMEGFTPDGTPLGAAWLEIWTRDEEEQAKTKAEKERDSARRCRSRRKRVFVGCRGCAWRGRLPRNCPRRNSCAWRTAKRTSTRYSRNRAVSGRCIG